MVLIDASVWVAIMNGEDSQHLKAADLIEQFFWDEVEVLDHMYAETLNVLRRKSSVDHCRKFVSFLRKRKIPFLLCESNSLDLANQIFFSHPKLSFTDALIIATAKLYGHEIISFDENLLRVWRSVR